MPPKRSERGSPGKAPPPTRLRLRIGKGAPMGPPSQPPPASLMQESSLSYDVDNVVDGSGARHTRSRCINASIRRERGGFGLDEEEENMTTVVDTALGGASPPTQMLYSPHRSLGYSPPRPIILNNVHSIHNLNTIFLILHMKLNYKN
ncbi:uncharacterized protein [Spinacia oleracea]|uniref:AT-hook motif nuclear-localized protein n=1 Tax=Spinacia oleracea TaxID=3562 RepID=A0ABM3R5J5_SPIOL|nr:uncharacterized protein LOC130466208 [Spinacia oleracea]